MPMKRRWSENVKQAKDAGLRERFFSLAICLLCRLRVCRPSARLRLASQRWSKIWMFVINRLSFQLKHFCRSWPKSKKWSADCLFFCCSEHLQFCCFFYWPWLLFELKQFCRSWPQRKKWSANCFFFVVLSICNFVASSTDLEMRVGTFSCRAYHSFFLSIHMTVLHVFMSA